MLWVILGCSIFVAFWAMLLLKGKRFIHRPMWQRLLSMGLVAGMMFGLVAYVNREASEKELVWAEGDKEVLWDRTPIRVIADPEIAKDVVQGAIDILNRDSCQLFVLVDPGTDWGVVILIGEYGKPSPGLGIPMAGSTWRLPGEEGSKYVIKLHDPGNITKQMLILAHELTHTAGLAHDNDPRFITTEGAQAHDDLSKFLPHLSQKDTRALKKRYCH